jgi:prepilin-type N-terminal cleavage/methylation domain-containing protein
MMRRRVRGRARGFTLAELMAVVAIMGVLAALAITALHHRAFQSDATSAKVVIKAIAVAEEHYRAENQVYLNVSSAADPGWYPQKTFTSGTRTTFWRAPPDAGADPETTAWQALMPDIRQQVTFGFKANAGLPPAAGLPTVAPSAVLDPGSGVTLPSTDPVEPWYLIQARTDLDNDGLASFVVAASWTPEVIVVNEGE